MIMYGKVDKSNGETDKHMLGRSLGKIVLSKQRKKSRNQSFPKFNVKKHSIAPVFPSSISVTAIFGEPGTYRETGRY